MKDATIESINESTDMKHLSLIESNMMYNISLLEDKNAISNGLRKKLVQEAKTYGVPSLKEYIKFKLRYYLSLKEACINRMIDLNRNTSSRSSTSSVDI